MEGAEDSANAPLPVKRKGSERHGIVSHISANVILPYPRNARFFPRGDLLFRVDEGLKQSASPVTEGQVQRNHCLALIGMGGVGKTQLALEYCYQSLAKYEVILWLRASTMVQLLEDVSHAAQPGRPLDDVMSVNADEDALSRLFRKAGISWLLIFDDLDDEDGSMIDAISKLSTTGARILVTARHPGPTGLTNMFSIGRMSPEEGRELIMHLVKSDLSDSKAELEAAHELSYVTGGLPSALATITSFVLHRFLTLTELLQAYEDNSLESSFKLTFFNDPLPMLESVWAQSFLELSEQGEQLLRFLSVLLPDNIPLGTLETIFVNEKLYQNHRKLQSLLEELTRLGFIFERSQANVVSTHRLTQREVLKRCSKDEIKETLSSAANCLIILFQSVDRPEELKVDKGWVLGSILTLEGHRGAWVRYEKSILIKELQTLQEHVRDKGLFPHLNAVKSDATVLMSSVLDSTFAVASVSPNAAPEALRRREHFEPVQKTFEEILASDPYLARSASHLFELAGRDTFLRKITDVLYLFSLHLHDEGVFSTQVSRISKDFVQRMVGSGKAFERALKRFSRRQRSISRSKIADARENNSVPSGSPSRPSCVDDDTEVSKTFQRVLKGWGLQTFKRELDIQVKRLRQVGGSEGSLKAAAPRFHDNVSLKAVSKGSLDTTDRSRSDRSLLEQADSLEIMPPGHFDARKPNQLTVTLGDRHGKTTEGQSTEQVEGRLGMSSRSHGLQTLGLMDRPVKSSRSQGDGAIPMKLINRSQNHPSSSEPSPAVSKDKEEEDFEDLERGSVPLYESSNSSDQGNAYLRLCIYRQNSIEVRHTVHDLSKLTDRGLYDLLREQYYQSRSWCVRLFSFRSVNQIRFVKFRLRRTGFVSIHADSSMERGSTEIIPRGEPGYKILEVPADIMPPIAHNEMLHYFRDKRQGKDSTYHISRLPLCYEKEIPFQGNEEEKFCWGLEIVGADYRRGSWMFGLAILALLISLTFGVVWSRAEDDVQTGFTVASWINSVADILLGATQVYLNS